MIHVLIENASIYIVSTLLGQYVHPKSRMYAHLMLTFAGFAFAR